MKLRHLRHFAAVGEQGNISRAARKLFLTQPALSGQIRDVEAELGVALFEHEAKAVRITEAGRVFEELRRYAVCVAVHPAHPLARARQIGLKDLAEEWLITFTAADYPEYHAWLADVFTSLKRPPQIAEEHDSATTLIAVVEAGRGVALMHEAFQCFAGPRLKIRRIIIPAVKRNGFGSLRQRSGEDAKPTPKTLRKRRLPNDRFHHRWGAGASHS